MSAFQTAKAGELALALTWNLATMKDAISWADSQIARQSEPADSLIELSLANSDSEALHHLSVLSRGEDYWLSVYLVMGRIAKSDSLQPKEASRLAKQVFHLAIRDDAPKWISGLVGFWDDIDLAVEGVLGDPEKITAEFLSEVRRAISHGVRN